MSSQVRRELRKDPSLCEEEDIDTASTISDDDDDENSGEGDALSDQPGMTSTESCDSLSEREGIKQEDDDVDENDRNCDDDGDEEEQFYSDSSYYSSSEDEDLSEGEELCECEDGSDQISARVNLKPQPIDEDQSSDDTEAGERSKEHANEKQREGSNSSSKHLPKRSRTTSTARYSEDVKENKRQKMKRGPLVRLHPEAVVPVTFTWDGPATSVLVSLQQ